MVLYNKQCFDELESFVNAARKRLTTFKASMERLQQSTTVFEDATGDMFVYDGPPKFDVYDEKVGESIDRCVGEPKIYEFDDKAMEDVMVGLSLGEKIFIKGRIAQDLRTDGRRRLTYRLIYVETGVIPQASGSARVKMGATDVIARVKAELEKPNLSDPDKGKVSIFVDCSPTAEPTFEGRGGDELSLELSSALQRCLLGGKSGAGFGIDLSSLSIVKGKVCWDPGGDQLEVNLPQP